MRSSSPPCSIDNRNTWRAADRACHLYRGGALIATMAKRPLVCNLFFGVRACLGRDGIVCYTTNECSRYKRAGGAFRATQLCGLTKVAPRTHRPLSVFLRANSGARKRPWPKPTSCPKGLAPSTLSMPSRSRQKISFLPCAIAGQRYCAACSSLARRRARAVQRPLTGFSLRLTIPKSPTLNQ